MKLYSLTATGEHLSKQFGAEPTPAMRILWFLRRQGGAADGGKIQEFVVGGEEYAIAIRKLKLAGAVTEA